jgi:hypothetical protein
MSCMELAQSYVVLDQDLKFPKPPKANGSSSRSMDGAPLEVLTTSKI